MEKPLSIKVIQNISEYKFKEKGSLFIGTAIPVSTEDKAINKLTELRKKYYDATHNCYAYIVNDGKSKYSDDGEPNGTAGIRIYNAIKHFEVTDLLVVSTRYFGGTKLGVGPLGKAYYDSAFQTLEQSKIETKTLHCKIILEYPFEFSNLLHRTLAKYSARIEGNEYADVPKIHILVKKDSIVEFIQEIKSGSNSNIKTLITTDFVYI